MDRSGSKRASVEGGIDLPLSEAAADAPRAQIVEGARARATEAPPLALRRTDELQAERESLGAALGALRERMRRYGEVTTSRSGFVGRVEIAAKSALRKLVKRHLDQEKEVHAALEVVLDRLSSLLDAEHRLLDENASILSEDAERRQRDR